MPQPGGRVVEAEFCGMQQQPFAACQGGWRRVQVAAENGVANFPQMNASLV